MIIDHPKCRRAEVRCVVDAHAGIGEGALWSPGEQALWWVEILEKKLHRFDPTTGIDRVFDLPGYVGCVALRERGGLMLALHLGFARFDPATAAIEILPDSAPPEPGARYNDGVVSPDGRMLATTMPIVPPFDDALYSLRMLDHDGRLRCLTSGLKIGNGLAFSPDGRTLYLSDSHPTRNCIWAFDWDADDGVAHNQRLFFDATGLPGHPDGAAIDSDGYYWYAAAYGWCLVRLTPTGEIDRIIPVPVQKPTKPAFGGARLDTLYLTSIGTNLAPGSEAHQPHAGGLLALEPGAIGLRPATVRESSPIASPSVEDLTR